MPGLRIHHPTARSCVLIVPHPGDPATGRRPKDYHVHLDADGNAIVSEIVWRRLCEAQASGLSPHGFVVLNEVPDPPTIRMSQTGRVEQRRTYRQTPHGVTDAHLLSAAQQFAPRGTKPRITRRNP